jgi:hypothetical protein
MQAADRLDTDRDYHMPQGAQNALSRAAVAISLLIRSWQGLLMRGDRLRGRVHLFLGGYGACSHANGPLATMPRRTILRRNTRQRGTNALGQPCFR